MLSAAQYPLFPSCLIRSSVCNANEIKELRTILEICGGFLQNIGDASEVASGNLEVTGGLQHLRRHCTEFPLLQFIQPL